MKKIALAASVMLVVCAVALLPVLLFSLPDDYADRAQEPEDLEISVALLGVVVVLGATGFANFARISALWRIGTRTLHALNVVSLLIVAIVAVVLLPQGSLRSLEGVVTGLAAFAVATSYWEACCRRP
jgi:hypothetical protein